LRRIIIMTEIVFSYESYMASPQTNNGLISKWITYTSVLNPTEPVDLRAINLVDKIALHGSQIYFEFNLWDAKCVR
jgi:hypothetical protein